MFLCVEVLSQRAHIFPAPAVLFASQVAARERQAELRPRDVGVRDASRSVHGPLGQAHRRGAGFPKDPLLDGCMV